MDKKEIGEQAETLAADFLRSKAYEVLVSNYRYKKGEIDLICKKDQRLIFVEVKFRTKNDFGMPETFVSKAQANRIIDAADHYIHRHHWEKDIRFDIVVISPAAQGYTFEHFEDAFY